MSVRNIKRYSPLRGASESPLPVWQNQVSGRRWTLWNVVVMVLWFCFFFVLLLLAIWLPFLESKEDMPKQTHEYEDAGDNGADGGVSVDVAPGDSVIVRINPKYRSLQRGTNFGRSGKPEPHQLPDVAPGVSSQEIEVREEESQEGRGGGGGEGREQGRGRGEERGRGGGGGDHQHYKKNEDQTEIPQDEKKWDYYQRVVEDYRDEMEGLQETVGNDRPDGSAVAFLLPLRGPSGAMGIRYGRPLKHRLEELQNQKSREKDVGGTITRSNTTRSNETKREEVPLGEEQSYQHTEDHLPTSVLVRDTLASAEVAKKMLVHFYEVHGTTSYFGLLTDDEALATANWARANAPGTRFVSPTASTVFLDHAKNIVRVQASARHLAQVVADLLTTVQATRPVLLTRTSVHNDAFADLLNGRGIRPAATLHYYPWTNLTALIRGRLQDTLSACVGCPVLLLGESESAHILKEADALFPATWVLPFAMQLFSEPPRLQKSEVLLFQYRPHDDKPTTGFMPEVPELDPTEGVVNASLKLLSGGRRTWRGNYVVAAAVPVSSILGSVRLVGFSDGWLPLLQYDLTPTGLRRRLYHELFLKRRLLTPLLPMGKKKRSACRLVVRYVEELTGRRRMHEAVLDGTLPDLVVPAERGAQVHLDCPDQHTDLQCRGPGTSWGAVRCQGSLQGKHRFLHDCHGSVGVRIAASHGCSAARGLRCRKEASLGCLLSGLCGSLLTSSRPVYECGGITLDSLE